MNLPSGISKVKACYWQLENNQQMERTELYNISILFHQSISAFWLLTHLRHNFNYKLVFHYVQPKYPDILVTLCVLDRKPLDIRECSVDEYEETHPWTWLIQRVPYFIMYVKIRLKWFWTFHVREAHWTRASNPNHIECFFCAVIRMNVASSVSLRSWPICGCWSWPLGEWPHIHTHTWCTWIHFRPSGRCSFIM